MLANIVEKWCLRGWYRNQKIPDLCGGAEQLPKAYGNDNPSNSLKPCTRAIRQTYSDYYCVLLSGHERCFLSCCCCLNRASNLISIGPAKTLI
ncbi:hypothetical protein [Endozoicomonas sp. SCSIO W0465]|uniref:hypothetical protein n=1 Tax=Endozoicomonas sp. SCSIO W0465 TaxID=2918516 RepID=UPI00207520A2|nr:hypothetical protein [Endozoicomonas sp. SCSIO W0465]USE36238.1 hypothetical protein MJO57_30085 [Endozoicomonas sp. SCSIO W0465]